ncbi:MAG: diguanylate cyclase [Thermodesulfobacteriota bacterium]
MTFNNKAILVIDDSFDSRTLICHILRQAGYTNILEADSARQAFEILEGPEISSGLYADLDLILLDIVMPNMDGITACIKLKALPQTSEVPIIMVTADTKDDSLQNAFDQGAMDYVNKPINRVELCARVKSALLLKHEMDKRNALTKELEAANKILQRTALTDGLTGIANRRYFDKFLEKEWRRCRREQHPITLCLADIDFFKAYNDSYGHLLGDDCLQKVATLLATNIKRPADLVSRYGGEEFAIILSETSEVGGCAVAKRVMATLKARNIPHEHSEVSDRITLSFGVAALIPRAGTAVHDLVAKADKALYEAKNMGRNQISCSCLKEAGQL